MSAAKVQVPTPTDAERILRLERKIACQRTEIKNRDIEIRQLKNYIHGQVLTIGGELGKRYHGNLLALAVGDLIRELAANRRGGGTGAGE